MSEITIEPASATDVGKRREPRRWVTVTFSDAGTEISRVVVPRGSAFAERPARRESSGPQTSTVPGR